MHIPENARVYPGSIKEFKATSNQFHPLVVPLYLTTTVVVLMDAQIKAPLLKYQRAQGKP